MGNAWNRADKTLFATLLIFAAVLVLRRAYPDSMAAQGLLFTAEAALVGGVADWFAVTALFRRPLGFPYHTAILPQRRKEFSEAVGRLIEREFFSRRQLFSLLHSYDWKGWLREELTEEPIRAEVRAWLNSLAGDLAAGFDCRRGADFLAARLGKALGRLSLDDVIEYLNRWLSTGDHDRRLLESVAAYLREKTADPTAREAVKALLENIRQEKVEGAGVLGAFFASMSQAMGIVDIDEIAALIQEETVNLLEQVGEKNSEIQARLLTILYRQLEACRMDPGIRETYDVLRERLIGQLPLAQAIEEGFWQIKNILVGEPSPQGAALQEAVSSLIETELSRCMAIFMETPEVEGKLDGLVYDIVARSTLQAKTLSARVVRDVMARLTDDQLNRIVYGKIEPDMIWIRLNGSIMGALLGGAIFLLLTAVR